MLVSPEVYYVIRLPARLHKSCQALEESYVLFILQVIQHFLQVDIYAGCKAFSYIQNKLFFKKKSNSSSTQHLQVLRMALTCCTVEFPPLSIAMPSFSVDATIGPISPAHTVTTFGIEEKQLTKNTHSM